MHRISCRMFFIKEHIYLRSHHIFIVFHNYLGFKFRYCESLAILQPAFMPDFQGFWLVFHTRALVQQCTWNLSNGDILKTYVLISGLIDCFLDRIGNWKRPFSCTSRFPNTLEKRVSSLWQCVWAVYYNMWIFGSCLLQRVAQCYKQVLWTSAFFQKVSDLETYFSGKGGLNLLLISYIEME